MLNIDTPIQYLKGVGPQFATVFNRLGIHTIGQLITHFPRAYDDRRQLPTVSQLKPDAPATIFVTITTIQSRTAPKPVLQARLSDESGSIEGVWFNQAFLQKTLTPGTRLVVSGKTVFNLYTQRPQFWVSEHEIIATAEDQKMSLGCVVPVYSLVAGLTGMKLRKAIATALAECLDKIEDPLPTVLREHYQLIPLATAIQQIHFPKEASVQKAKERLVFDEFLHMQLPMAFRRRHAQVMAGPVLTVDGELIRSHLAHLPYTLTHAQKSVIQTIAKDVQSGRAMNRLVQGDVGCGKTDVALMSLLFAIESGYKAAIMAPLEILASQHYLKFTPIFERLGIPILLLKSKVSKAARKTIHDALQAPGPAVLVGTHALLEDEVVIDNLGMVVIDEQHRFGVLQRIRLRDKGQSPHCLFLTATPIPRSLMLTCYGDLDKSIITELPPGRRPCHTACLSPSQLARADQFCLDQLRQGRQVFIVLPLIEESEKIDLRAAMQEYERVQSVFKEYKVALLHGKLTNKEKDAIMTEFKKGTIHVLVATTVIEVGVDVPNATVMLIHHADRFGLSQLHQLRGRVGRSDLQSHCLLIANPKTDDAKKRIRAMLDTTDGFKIAQVDLAIRGPGDFLGYRQAGLPELHLADLIQDEQLLLKAKDAAQKIITSDPNLEHPMHQALKMIMMKTRGDFLKKRLN